MLVPDTQHSDLMFQTDQHNKSSYNMSPYKEATQLFLDSPHSTFHSHDSYFADGSLYLLISRTYFSPPFPVPSANTCLFSVSMTLFLSLTFVPLF